MRTFATLVMACVTSVSFVIAVAAIAELWTWGFGSIQPYEVFAFFWTAGPGTWLVKRWANGVKRRSEALKASNTATPPPAA